MGVTGSERVKRSQAETCGALFVSMDRTNKPLLARQPAHIVAGPGAKHAEPAAGPLTTRRSYKRKEGPPYAAIACARAQRVV
jgi:hypothetical protein